MSLIYTADCCESRADSFRRCLDIPVRDVRVAQGHRNLPVAEKAGHRRQRQSFASHAVMQGTPLPVVARLLGHSQMTMRYAHTGDRETEAAAERIGEVISGMLEFS